MEPNVCPTNLRFVGNRNAFDKRVRPTTVPKFKESRVSQALLHLRHIVWNGYVTGIIRFRYADKFYTSQAGIKFTGRPSSSAILQGCWCRRLRRFQLVSL